MQFLSMKPIIKEGILSFAIILSSCTPQPKPQVISTAEAAPAPDSVPALTEDYPDAGYSTYVPSVDYFREVDTTEVQLNEYGVVCVDEKIQEERRVSIYNEDGTEWKEISTNDYTTVEDLNPYFSKLDYGILVFKCVGISEKGYAVIVDEAQQTIKYIRKDTDGMKYESWADHVAGTYAIGFSKDNPPRRSPAADADIVVFLDEDPTFNPVRVEGDWLLIKTDDDHEGWVKWRTEGGYLNIALYYLC